MDPKQAERLRQAYLNTFGTPEGKLVLADLRRAAQYDCTAYDPASDRTTVFILGKQDLFRFIEKHLTDKPTL